MVTRYVIPHEPHKLQMYVYVIMIYNVYCVYCILVALLAARQKLNHTNPPIFGGSLWVVKDF